MPLPDPHANESTAELDRDVFKLWQEAKAAEKAWEAEAERLKKKIVADLGEAFAGTIDGVKVVSHRPKSSYAERALQKDYPDLVEHFMEYRAAFNVWAFAEAHPEIADNYRVRALTELTGP